MNIEKGSEHRETSKDKENSKKHGDKSKNGGSHDHHEEHKSSSSLIESIQVVMEKIKQNKLY